MQDIRVRLALLGICLVCFLGCGWVLLRGAGPSHLNTAPITLSPPPEPMALTAPAPEQAKGQKTVITAPAPPTRLYVDVSGAVQRPSLYVLPPGSRVMQAVRAAGGPTGEADLDAINLAEKVADGQKVFVPKRTAAVPPSTVPLPAGAAPTATKKSAGAKAGSSKISAGSAETVALNAATQEQLERLPGVGPSMAAKILAYRAQIGGFEKPDDLMQVPGLGPKKYAKIAPFITL